MNTDPSTALAELSRGDTSAFPQLFTHFRPRLRNMVRLRIGNELSARIDPSDVLQDAFVEAARRVDEFVLKQDVSFFIWLRGITWNRLLKLQRQHIGAARRSITREVYLNLPGDISAAVGLSLTTPSTNFQKAELQSAVQAGVAMLNDSDREVILMRHFEGLSNLEVAAALGLSPSGATMRHGRALAKLKSILQPLVDEGSEND